MLWMAKGYWSRVRARALHECNELVGFVSRGRTMIAILVALVVILFLRIFGSEGSLQDRLVEIGGATVAVAAVYFFVFVWKFIRAPAELASEAEEAHANEVARLTAEIERLRGSRDSALMHELSDSLAKFSAAVKALPRGVEHQLPESAREAYRRAGEILEQMADGDIKLEARDYLQCAAIILDKKANHESTREDEADLLVIGRRVFAVLNDRDKMQGKER